MEPIRHAVRMTIHQFPVARGLNPVESAARVLNLAVGTVYNKTNEGADEPSADLFLRQAVILMNAAQDYRILLACAEACDHAAIPLADFRGTSDTELITLMAAETEAAGQKAAVIRRALEDRRLTAQELRAIREAFHWQVRAGYELLARLEAIADGR